MKKYGFCYCSPAEGLDGIYYDVKEVDAKIAALEEMRNEAISVVIEIDKIDEVDSGHPKVARLRIALGDYDKEFNK